MQRSYLAFLIVAIAFHSTASAQNLPIQSANQDELFPQRPAFADWWSTQERNWLEPSLIVRGQSEEEGGGGDSGDLASKSQNPVSDLVSLPLQNNFNYGIPPENRTQYVGNLQPVVPVKLNEDWNLINRVIVPFINTPLDGDLREHGIGDTVGQFFFSPRNSEELIWGVGPSVMFPTASDPALGFQKWGAGITGVALISQKPIVAGVLVNQIWSESATTQPLLIQPFFNYNLPGGWFLLAGGEANADWQQPQDRRWSFPFGPGFGRVFPLFGQPINASVRFAPYLEKPTNGPDWQFRLQINLLFPK